MPAEPQRLPTPFAPLPPCSESSPILLGQKGCLNFRLSLGVLAPETPTRNENEHPCFCFGAQTALRTTGL